MHGLYNRGYMYDTALSYYIAPTEEDVEAYFTEHESDYAEAGITRNSGKLVDIRHILLIPQVPEDRDGNRHRGARRHRDLFRKNCGTRALPPPRRW